MSKETFAQKLFAIEGFQERLRQLVIQSVSRQFREALKSVDNT